MQINEYNSKNKHKDIIGAIKPYLNLNQSDANNNYDLNNSKRYIKIQFKNEFLAIQNNFKKFFPNILKSSS